MFVSLLSWSGFDFWCHIVDCASYHLFVVIFFFGGDLLSLFNCPVWLPSISMMSDVSLFVYCHDVWNSSIHTTDASENLGSTYIVPFFSYIHWIDLLLIMDVNFFKSIVEESSLRDNVVSGLSVGYWRGIQRVMWWCGTLRILQNVRILSSFSDLIPFKALNFSWLLIQRPEEFLNLSFSLFSCSAVRNSMQLMSWNFQGSTYNSSLLHGLRFSRDFFLSDDK